MSTAQILRRLYSSDTSSPYFLRSLHALIRRDEEEQYLASLRGSELALLVDFLDKVRAIPSVFHQFTKQTPQALSAIPITEDVAQKCIKKLQVMCGDHAILPSSYIVSSKITIVGVVHGAIVDVWEGTYRDEKVSVKCLKICTEDYRTLKKVRIRYGTSHRIYSRTPMGAAVILQRGRHLEKVKTPERHPFYRCYDRSFTNHLEVDAERNSNEVRREKSRHESDRPSEPSLVIAPDR